MSQDIINEQTDENIKNYLSEEKIGDLGKLENNDFGDNNKNILKNKKVILVIVILILISILSLFYFARNKGKQSFDETKVGIEIEVLSNVASGEEIAFDIKYKNNTDVSLRNAKISFFIPRGFIFISSDKEIKTEETVLTWSLEKISAGEMGNIKLFGKVMGELDKEFNFNSKISYTPDNFNYEFESADSLSRAKVKIVSVPFELIIQSPEIAMSEDEIEYVINYKNISNYDFKFINIEVNLPEGFVCSSLDIEPNKREGDFLTWNVENLVPGAEGKFVIKGNIKTDISSEKEIKVTLNASEDGEEIFEYVNQTTKIKIEEIPITIKQFVNSSEEFFVTQGGELEYKIKFKNISDKEIRGLVINSELVGEVDFDSLEVINGSYDKKANKITWSAFNVPELALFKAKGEGEVSFKVKVKDQIKIEKSDEKNFVIENSVKISSFNSDSVNTKKIIASNKNVVKVEASLFIGAKGYFNDDGRIENIGSIPPEVGKETNYLIHWNLSSLFNDLNNVRIVSVLPEGVDWTGNYIKSNEDISFGDQINGAFTPEEVDSETIENINGGLGENRLEVGYNWYDKTVRDNDKENALPGNLKTSDTLEFTYNDNNIKEVGYCVIKEHPVSKEHNQFCSVPWKTDLPFYTEKGNYKIKKVMSEMSEERFYYNSETREVIWEMPKLYANTGITSPVKEVVFQVKIKPTEIDIGKDLQIMNEVKAVGYDEYIGKEIEAFDSEFTTELPDDYSIGINEGIVVKGTEE